MLEGLFFRALYFVSVCFRVYAPVGVLVRTMALAQVHAQVQMGGWVAPVYVL